MTYRTNAKPPQTDLERTREMLVRTVGPKGFTETLYSSSCECHGAFTHLTIEGDATVVMTFNENGEMSSFRVQAV